MAEYEVGPNGPHPAPAFWGFHPQQENFVRTLTIPNPQHYGLHPVGGGVPPHPHAMTPRTVDENELQDLRSRKAHLEMQIGGLQQRLGELNRQIQALTARLSQLDH